MGFDKMRLVVRNPMHLGIGGLVCSLIVGIKISFLKLKIVLKFLLLIFPRY